MKTQIAVVTAAVLLLLAIGVASAQPGGPGVAKDTQTGEYVLCSGVSSIGGAVWQVSGIASGGDFQLTPLSMPSDQAGCTCDALFLPMTRK